MIAEHLSGNGGRRHLKERDVPHKPGSREAVRTIETSRKA